jgi:hypothetical protein
MGTDFSRVRLNGLLDYAAVELKQGAVFLDADANAGMDILDRRLRALGGDVLGPVMVSATTPDAFEIKPAAGTLTIGVGRIYVDGLLAECHGGDVAAPADRRFDRILAEPRFANPLPYSKQPYPPSFPLPALPTSGRHLVYLDVWNREVTELEQPDLVEIAVGVETSSRIQTVWQVRVLAPDAGVDSTCASPDSDFPGWAAITAPSTGVLTTDTFQVDPVTDPCELPPTGGYRGLENQLYRVEIHDSSASGAATFKWSRFNASIGSRVASLVSAGELQLETLGRDDLLSFKTGDWVEITDDFREFAGRPGDIRKVVVDSALRRITFAPPLSADLLPSPQAFPNTSFPKDRNQRVTRWDQSGAVNRTDPSGIPVQIADLNAAGSTGLIAVPPATTVLLLEHGVTVNFDPGPNGFRTGDYWVFAARTEDASVERLDHAPPRGIHHHYARLGIWDVNAGTVTDCRPKRTAGCCTFVVKPGEDIQAAINALPNVGGCVCLRAGLHPITKPIRIVRDNVCLHGESLGAIVANPRGSALLEIEGAEHTRIHTIVFRQIEAAAAPTIHAMAAEDLVIDDCRVEAADRGNTVGIRVDGSADVVISGSAFLWQGLGIWFDEGCRDVTVSECEFMLGRAIGRISANVAILARNMRGPITAQGNAIDGIGDGIIVNDSPNDRPFSRADGSRIWGNRLKLSGKGAQAGQTAYGIDVASRESSVGDNKIDYDGGDFVGIRLAGSGSSACGNSIVARPTGQGFGTAIFVGYFVPESDLAPVERIVVADNVAEGAQNGILVIGASRCRVAGNILDAASGTFLGLGLYACRDAELTENILRRAQIAIYSDAGARLSVCGNRLDLGGVGIYIRNDQAPTISGNRLTDLEQGGIFIESTTQRCHVIENRILRCGAGTDIAFGLRVTEIAGELHVESNEIMDIGLRTGGPATGGMAPLAYGIAGESIWEARIESNLVTYSDASARSLQAEDRALRLSGFFDWQVNDAITFGFAIQITNNKFIGPGASALVELRQLPFANNQNIWMRFERVLFHGNYCWHFAQRPAGTPTTRPKAVATVSLVGRHCSVTGNHVKATTNNYPSYDLHGMPGPFIANVSQSGHSGRGTQMPNPESAFNTNA